MINNSIYKFIASLSCLLLILFCALIFIMSAQNGSESSEVSENIVNGALGVDKDRENYKHALFIVRKCAHFFEYAVLSILAFAFVILLHRSIVKYKKSLIISFCFSVIYAITDEIHQLFVPGRAGKITDVLIDACGAFWGITVCYIVIRVVIKKQAERSSAC